MLDLHTILLIALGVSSLYMANRSSRKSDSSWSNYIVTYVFMYGVVAAVCIAGSWIVGTIGHQITQMF